MTSDLKKCFIEFLGTFLIAFSILCSLAFQLNHLIIPIIVGAIILSVMYAGAPISGGNFNPAISITSLFIGRMGSKKTLLYCLFQILGACYAALMVLLLSSSIKSLTPLDFPIPTQFVGETIFTTAFILIFCFAYLSKRVQGNNYFGLAIGSAAFAGISMLSSVCLAVFNPAVTISIALLGLATSKTIIWGLIAQLISILIATALFKLFNIDNIEKIEVVEIDEFIKK